MSTKLKTTRALCYVPVAVKKSVQERRANDPRPSPPSENTCYLEMLEASLAEFDEFPTLTTSAIFRIKKDSREYFAPVGIRMTAAMHRALKKAAKDVPQFNGLDREPVNYRFIDIVAYFLSRAISGFQITNI